jgi:hypothetical protein
VFGGMPLDFNPNAQTDVIEHEASALNDPEVQMPLRRAVRHHFEAHLGLEPAFGLRRPIRLLTPHASYSAWKTARRIAPINCLFYRGASQG